MWCGSTNILLAILLMAILTVPPGAAQQGSGPELSVEPVREGGLLEDGAGHTIPVQVGLRCPPPSAVPSPLPTEVALSMQVDPDWAVAVFDADRLTFDSCPADEAATETATLQLNISEGAPPSELKITVTARMGETEETVVWRERVGVRMETDFRFAKTLWRAGQNDQVSIPLTMTNHGNDRIEVSFRLADNTSDDLMVVLPGIYRVDPGQDSTIAIDVKTPFENGYLEQRDMLHLVVTARAESNQTIEEQAELSAAIETVGAYLPGPAPVLLLVALFALVRWRVGRETRSKV